MSYNTGFRTLRLRRRDLEKLQEEGRKTEIEMVGLLYADEDVTPDLIEATVSKVKIYGRIIALPGVKQAILSRDASI